MTHTGPTVSFRAHLPLLGRYLAPQGGRVTLMAALLLAGIGLGLLVPLLLGRFVDGATGARPDADLSRLALAFLAVALLRQLAGAGATYLAADVGWTATNALRRDLLAHVLGLDAGSHHARTPGEMIERIDGDATALANFFSQFSVRVLGGALLLVGVLATLWVTVPALGLALTLFTGLELLVLARTRRIAVPASTLEREAHARLFGFIEERLAGLDDLRANGGGAHALHRFRGPMRAFLHGTRRAWMLRSALWLSSYGMFVLGTAVALGGAIALVGRGALTLGGAYMVFQYLLMLQAPIDQITQQLQDLQKAGAGLARIGELLEERSALPAHGRARLPDGPLGLELDAVHFAYGATPTLADVSLALAPGRSLGLVGRTGAGKTTLARLLLRFHDPRAGAVRLAGQDLRDLAPGALRGRVALVTQDVQLFRGSLRDNLALFAEGVRDGRLRAVLEELGLGAWLDGLPAGLDTEIEADGANLSAGEAQLLAFARVFLEDPGLVVLDEPSSRLDPATEARLQRATARLLRGRTAVVIAHRLETLERVDEVLVLEGGRVVEHGPRAALAADPGSRWARLRALGLDPAVAGPAAREEPA